MVGGKNIKRNYKDGRETTLFSGQKRKPLKKERPSSVSRSTPQPKVLKNKNGLSLPKEKTDKTNKSYPLDSYELPSNYGITRLTLLVKDPFWIYAYWEIAPEDIESVREKIPPREAKEAKLVLRMYDITYIDFNGSNANHYFDLEVGFQTNNWYINLWRDNVSYVGELGLRTKRGNFFVLTRSNYVQTPRSGYSPRSEQMWMKITSQGTTSSYVTVKPSEAKKIEKISPKQKRIIYLREEDIRRYYSKLSPLLRDVIASRLTGLYRDKFKKPIIGEEDAFKKALALFPKDYFIKMQTKTIGSSENLIFLGASESAYLKPERNTEQNPGRTTNFSKKEEG